MTITGSNLSQRVAVAPIEPRACAARPEPDGTLTVWSSTQTPHQDRDGLAAALGLEPDQVRLIAPDVGGGFGGKGLAVEETLVAWLRARPADRCAGPRRAAENMIGIAHGRGQRVEFELGGDRDGKVRALRVRFLQEAGAYPGSGRCCRP